MTPGHWRIRETTFVRLFFLQAMDEIWDGTKISSHRTDLRNVVAKRCVEDSPKNFLPKVEKAFWCLESLVDIEIWATIKYTGSIHDKGTPFFRLATFGRKPEALPEKAAERRKLMGCTALWLNPVVKQRRCKLRILVWGPVECWLVGFP